MSTNRIVKAPGHYILEDIGSGKVSYWQREFQQSAADREGVSTADYIHAMYFFLMQQQCRDVLMIGCGGGTLATMLHRSGVAVTVIDLNPMAFDIAHDHFRMPREIACHVADGGAYLKAQRHCHDALVLDAFGAQGMPDTFKTPAFFRLAKSRLKPRGSLFLMNVIVDDDDDSTPDNLVRALRQEWSQVRLLDTDGWIDRNAVIAAGAVAALKKPQVLMPPRPGGPKLAKELAILDWRSIRWS